MAKPTGLHSSNTNIPEPNPFTTDFPSPDGLRSLILAIDVARVSIKKLLDLQNTEADKGDNVIKCHMVKDGKASIELIKGLSLQKNELAIALIWYQRASRFATQLDMTAFFGMIRQLQERDICMVCTVDRAQNQRCPCGYVNLCSNDCKELLRNWHEKECAFLSKLPTLPGPSMGIPGV